MIPALISLVAGAVFAAGICIAGGAQPSKIRHVLDIAGGAWDPTMIVLMIAAVATASNAWRYARPPRKPPFGDAYPPPPSRIIDLRLVGGSAIFGIGWGISGLCPSTAIPSLVTGLPGALTFSGALIVGMVLARVLVGADAPTACSPLGGAGPDSPSDM